MVETDLLLYPNENSHSDEYPCGVFGPFSVIQVMVVTAR